MSVVPDELTDARAMPRSDPARNDADGTSMREGTASSRVTSVDQSEPSSRRTMAIDPLNTAVRIEPANVVVETCVGVTARVDQYWSVCPVDERRRSFAKS
jgi:hypothetical protein